MARHAIGGGAQILQHMRPEDPRTKSPKPRDNENPDPQQYRPAASDQPIDERAEQDAREGARPDTGPDKGGDLYKPRPDDGTE